MPRHSETKYLPYTPDQMFDLVADVARYHEFLPWVTAVRVRSSSDTQVVADLIVGFGAFTERFTSRVTKDRTAKRITVDYLEGPLKYLKNEWRFDPAEGGSTVFFSVDFAFRSRLFETVAGAVFDRALRRMTGAFETRAAALYGASEPELNAAAG